MPSWSAVDENNSTTTPLGAGETFSGTWRRVVDYVSVLVHITSDVSPAANGVQIQWSHDGFTEDESLRQPFSTLTQMPLVKFTRSQYYRVVYHNGAQAQSVLGIHSVLRRQTAHGSVSPAGRDINPQLDALTVNSVLYAQRQADPSNLVVLQADNNDFLFITHRLNGNLVQSERTITASTAFAQDLDLFGLFSGTRQHFHVFNDTLVGNLYIRWGASASLTSFSVKVPPQGLYEIPAPRNTLAENISGIWDVADGAARSVEFF